MFVNSATLPSDRLALRQCRLFETMDVDDARENISRVMQPHNLRAHGRDERFRSHMDFLRLLGMGVGTIAFGQASIDVPPLDDYYLVILCLAGSALIRNGREEITIDRFNGIAFSPGSPVFGQFSPDCEQLVVRIDRKRMLTFTGQRNIQLASRVDLRSPRLAPWLATLQNMVSDPATVTLIQDDIRVATEYEQLLLRLLLVGQEWSDNDRKPSGVRPASVHRAIAYLRAHSCLAVTLADVAQAAGVPERTLHNAFKHFEGVSPLRYLRDLRLDSVRGQLRAGAERANVTTIAMDAGFTHLSRFAQDYLERFGERPSETLRGMKLN